MKKIISIILIAVVVMALTLSVNAYTNNDVISYITKAHTVNGRTVQLNSSQRNSLTKYLQDNPVTEAEANSIISQLDSAKSKLDNSGATNLSQLSDSVKAEVIALVKSAGAVAGLDVQVNTANETVVVKDSKGATIIGATSYSQFNATPSTTTNSGKSSTAETTSTTKKLVYTGNSNYTVVLKAGIAIVAVAIIGLVLKNKYAK